MSLNRDALRACVYLQTLKEPVRRQNTQAVSLYSEIRTWFYIKFYSQAILPFLELFFVKKVKMSDSESDSDLAVEQYDPEDNLNAYGSPVVRPVDEEILAVAPARQNIESNRTQVFLFYV